MNGNNVAFETGFSLSNPTGTGSNFSFNQNSGNVCLTPNLIGNFVIAIRVDEYRNNVIVGSTVRDFQISVVDGVAIANQDITGTVTDGNGIPVAGVSVELFEYGISLGNLNLAATQSTNASGEFSFIGQDVGQYLIRSQPSSGFIATYHQSTAYWQYAQVLYRMCDAQVTTNITLVDQNNPIGTGVIAGYLNGTGVVKSSGDPLDDVNILLYEMNSDTLVQHSITDQNGFYELENIPSGSYYILVDLEGLSMISTHFIDIQDGEIIQEANFFADENGILIVGDYQSEGFANLQSAPSNSNFYVHPNPGKDKLFITNNSKDPLEMVMFNSLGAIVIEKNSKKTSLELQTHDLPSGIYYITISNSSSTQHLKWIKK